MLREHSGAGFTFGKVDRGGSNECCDRTTKMPLTALAIRRITRDINTVMSETGMGYYYVPDDTNMAHGWAVII